MRVCAELPFISPLTGADSGSSSSASVPPHVTAKTSSFSWHPSVVKPSPAGARVMLLLTGDYTGRITFWAVGLSPGRAPRARNADRSDSYYKRSLVKLGILELPGGHQVTSLVTLSSTECPDSAGSLFVGTHTGHLIRYDFDVKASRRNVSASLVYDVVVFSDCCGIDGLYSADDGANCAPFLVVSSHSRLIIWAVDNTSPVCVPQNVSRHSDQVSGISISPTTALSGPVGSAAGNSGTGWAPQWTMYSCGFDGLIAEYVVETMTGGGEFQAKYVRNVSFAYNHQQCLGLSMDPSGLMLACLYVIPGLQQNTRLVQSQPRSRRNHIGLSIRDAPREMVAPGPRAGSLATMVDNSCLDSSWVASQAGARRVLENLLGQARMVPTATSLMLLFVYSCVRIPSDVYGCTDSDDGGDGGDSCVEAIDADAPSGKLSSSSRKPSDWPRRRVKSSASKIALEAVVKRLRGPPLWVRMVHSLSSVVAPAVDELWKDTNQNESTEVGSAKPVSLLQLLHCLCAVTRSVLLTSDETPHGALVAALSSLVASLRALLQGFACIQSVGSLGPNQTAFLVNFDNTFSGLLRRLEADVIASVNWHPDIPGKFDASGSLRRLVGQLSKSLSGEIRNHMSKLNRRTGVKDYGLAKNLCPVCACALTLSGQFDGVLCTSCSVSAPQCCFSLSIIDPLALSTGPVAQVARCACCGTSGLRQQTNVVPCSSLFCPYCRAVMLPV